MYLNKFSIKWWFNYVCLFSLKNIIRFRQSCERFPALTSYTTPTSLISRSTQFFGQMYVRERIEIKAHLHIKKRTQTELYRSFWVRYSEIWLGKHKRVMKANSLSLFECTGLELQSRLFSYSVSCNQFSKMRLNNPFIASCWEFMKSCLIVFPSSFKFLQLNYFQLLHFLLSLSNFM